MPSNDDSDRERERSPGIAANAGESDLRLVRRVLRRERAALDEFARRIRCIPRILGSRNRRFGRPLNGAELDDLSQDVLVKVWNKLETFDGRAPVEGWIYRFCYLEFLYALRTRRHRPPEVCIDDDTGSPIASPASEAPDLGKYESLHRTLDSLAPEAGRILDLKHFQGMTFEQIAERTGDSINTIKTRYYRAIATLRRRLSSGEHGGQA